MKTLLIQFVILLGFSGFAKADTIDYWHVYYNKEKIQEYSLNSDGEIVVKIKKIKPTDSLIIYYFSDTPCRECPSQVTIEHDEQVVIREEKNLGKLNIMDPFAPIEISVYELLQYHLKNEEEYYRVVYQEEPGSEKSRKVELFRIRLE